MAGTLWGRVKSGSKTGFDKVYNAVDKLGPPVNKLSNKLGSEAFWPTTLDKESDKAARILRSFCKDGFYTEDAQPSTSGPAQRQRVLKSIPPSVIADAKALAIFTTMRTGLWMSGASGSGILIARKDDGSWSPPSGIMLHTAGLGFIAGIDIYDCVVVINTPQALEAFYKVRCTLGSEVSVAAGPVGVGGVLDTEVHKRRAPVFTYMKSRGFYAGVQIDGTVVIERTDENERFYGTRLPVREILAGRVQYPPVEVKRLLETLRAAQGDTDVDTTFLSDDPPPGDYELIDDTHIFGVPDREDPDPYGLLALEKEGMLVREAGTHERASWEQFSFNPAPSSPLHAVFARASTDRPGSIMSRRSSWRTSTLTAPASTRPPSSLRVSEENPRTPATTMTDSSTQTDFPAEPSSPRGSGNSADSSRRSSKGSGRRSSAMQDVPEHEVLGSRVEVQPANGHLTPPSTPPLSAPTSAKESMASPPSVSLPEDASTPPPSAGVAQGFHEKDDKDNTDMSSHHIEDSDADVSASDNDADDSDNDEATEEPIIQSIQTIQPIQPQQQPQAVSLNKARLVTVPKRVPPKLPERNPNRGSGRGRGKVVVGGSPTGSARSSGEGSLDALGAVESPSAVGGASVNETAKGLREIKLDVDEEEEGGEEEVRIDGWAKARASREKGRRVSGMPGGFD